MHALDITQALVDFLRRWGELGPASGAILALAFVLNGLVPVPRTFLCLAAGVVFGLASVPIIIPAATIGGVLAFLLARYLFAGWVHRAIDGKPRYAAIMNAVDAEGWRIVALCRIASPIPSMPQSALFGVTRIDLWTYTWATFVFTIPQIVLYVYLGAIGRAALLDEPTSGIGLGVMAAGGVTFAVVLWLIARRVRETMRQSAMLSP